MTRRNLEGVNFKSAGNLALLVNHVFRLPVLACLSYAAIGFGYLRFNQVWKCFLNGLADKLAIVHAQKPVGGLVGAGENQPAIRLYEQCGFVTEGVLRRAVFRDEQYLDELVMALLLE